MDWGNFPLSEMTRTQVRITNDLPEELVPNMKRLVDVLEAIRVIVGKPVNVSSGYRSFAVNQAVKGSRTSAHCRALAADIYVNSMTAYELAKLLEPMVQRLGIDQLIYEGTWVHVGLSETAPRGQKLTARFSSNKPVVYEQGINR